jgi:hypothetical protein
VDSTRSCLGLCCRAAGRCGALTASPGDHHTAAQRTPFNQLPGRLHRYPKPGSTTTSTPCPPVTTNQPTPQRDTLTAWDFHIARKNYQAITAPLEAEPAAA